MKSYNVVAKLQEEIKTLKECNESMSLDLGNLISEITQLEESVRYMNDFIRYNDLEKEYSYFKKYAREEDDPENPFPYLVL